MHARALLPWVTVAVATVVAATAIPAQAAFPGRNGKIVFQTNRDGNAEIYTMNADGTSRVNLTRNPAEDVAPRWSPDGGRIVFASNRTGNFEIYTMQADGSGVTRLTFTTADNGRPSWTADGRILFHTDRDGNREIYLMNADGGGQQNLTQSSSYDAFPAASPEGKKIVFTSDRGGDYHLYLLNAGPVRQLTNTPGAEDFEANWSPHGNDLVFVRFDSSFANSELYTMHADGSGLSQLTNTPSRTEFEPAWSPDGKKIVFHSCTGLNTADQSDDHCVNSVINADGSGETEITRTPQAPFVETFDSGVLDSSYWYTIADSGGSVGLVNGRLEEFISHDADPTLHNFNQVDEQLGFQCRLNGDFDYQADYTLMNWPAHNGFFDSLNAIFGGGSISRMSTPYDPPYDESYGAWTDSPTFSFGGLNTTDRSGQMRLVRQAGVMYGYARSGPSVDWTLIHAGPASGSTIAAMELQAPLNSWAHVDGLVAWDNFRLNSGPTSCPTWWDDNAPDWQPIGR